MFLEHHAAVGARSHQGLAVKQNFAGGRRQKTGNAVQQGGLAAARGAQGNNKVAVVHRQVDWRKRLKGAAFDGVIHRQVLDFKSWHKRGSEDLWFKKRG